MERAEPESLSSKTEIPTGDQLRSRLLQEYYLHKSINPQPLDTASIKSVLVLAPHQDDEVIGAGGLLTQLRDQGSKITIAYLTDGVMTDEVNDFEDSYWVEQRRNESIDCCGVLSANRYELGISNRSCVITLDVIKMLAGIIKREKPDVLLLPWFLDAPAKHRLANYLLYLTETLEVLPNYSIIGYQVRGHIYSNTFADITSCLKEKAELIKTYVSQIENFHRYDHQYTGSAAWNSRFLSPEWRKKTQQYLELFLYARKKQYLEVVETIYVTDLSHVFQNNAAIVSAVRRINKQVMAVANEP